MRNHLISVSIGFALGGLILVPLTLQLHDPGDEAAVGATAPPGLQPNQDVLEPPLRARAAPHKSTQPAPHGFDDSKITAASPTSIESDAAAKPAPDGKRRFVLFLPPLPQRPAVPLTSFELCLSGPANAWTASSTSTHEWLAHLPTWGQTRSGWTGGGLTSADRLALPDDINLREDYRERFGLIAAMQMANIPRQEDEPVAFVPPTLRLTDRPAAILPQTQPGSTLFNRPQAGNGISDPFVTVAVPQPPAVRSPVAPAVPTANSANPQQPVGVYGPTSPVSPVAESPVTSVRPNGLGSALPPTTTIGSVPLGAGAPGSNVPSAPASGSGATGSGLPVVGGSGPGSVGSGGGGSGGSSPIASGGSGSSSGTGGSPPDPRSPGDGTPPGIGNPVTFTGGWNPPSPGGSGQGSGNSGIGNPGTGSPGTGNPGTGNPGTGNGGGLPVTITPAHHPVTSADGEAPPSGSTGTGFGGSINLPIGSGLLSPHPSGPIRTLPGQPGADLVDPDTSQPTTGTDAAFPEPASLVLFAAGAALVIRRKMLRG